MTNALILHDVLIDGADGLASQIDLLMIGVKGIYVVEEKCTLMPESTEMVKGVNGTTISIAKNMKYTAR